jgi:hypothetical protein
MESDNLGNLVELAKKGNKNALNDLFPVNTIRRR